MKKISDDVLVAYAARKLPREKRAEIDRYLAESPETMDRLIVLRQRMIETCRHVRESFHDFYQDDLPEERTAFISTHLSWCRPCLDLFDDFVRKQEPRDNPILYFDCGEAIKQLVAAEYGRNKPGLGPFAGVMTAGIVPAAGIMPVGLKLAAATGSFILSRLMKPGDEIIWHEDPETQTRITVWRDKTIKLKVHSIKYYCAAIHVTLSRIHGDQSIDIASGTTSTQGIARLDPIGETNDMIVGEAAYRITLTNLRERRTKKTEKK